ncbi:hypothetical protein QBC35DRAFT_468115 [Podospora australis]|uniref:CFEM domain-containing protein n=1 Tax=Podospora australis TaxID=1536484 RepID=A0AAN6WJI0_9PEZI|nr:hypothetical protein QBC35DRAFT_468115 [Podospora australis]
MQVSTLLITALAAVASASPAINRRQATDPNCPQLDSVPVCGRECILSAAEALGCSRTDYPCLCGQWDALRTNAANCVISGCGILNTFPVLDAAQAVCDACA